MTVTYYESVNVMVGYESLHDDYHGNIEDKACSAEDVPPSKAGKSDASQNETQYTEGLKIIIGRDGRDNYNIPRVL